MLARLQIRDFLLVKDVNLDFQRGFTAITGETGAGKSMILGALRVLFGATLTEQMIRDGAERTIIEADFRLAAATDVRELLGEDYWDDETSTISVRRELMRGGRARGFLQDRPATIDFLRQVGERVMDFHGQRDSLSLFRASRQLDFLDAFAGTSELCDQVSRQHRKRADLLLKRNGLQDEVQTRRKEQALLAYQLEEIERLGLKEGEEEDIASRLKRLEQAERLALLSGQIAGLLEQDDTCAISLVGQARQLADDAKRFDEHFAPIASELEDLAVRLRDLSSEVTRHAEQIVADPEELELLRQRAGTLSDLRRKHGVDIAQILLQARRMKETLAVLADMELQMAKTEEGLAEAESLLTSLASDLSAKRHSAAAQFSRIVTESLLPLGFASPKFEVKLDTPSPLEAEQIHRNGADQIQFHFSGATGQPLLPLSDVASGGESSRVTLAIKSVVAERMNYPLLVYDEVDLGISGRIATAVANLLCDLGRAQQVIVVTHLPQIAARAEHHLLVSKLMRNRSAVTTAAMLKPDERAQAVAALLAGSEISGSALAAADDLLHSRHSSKEQAE